MRVQPFSLKEQSISDRYLVLIRQGCLITGQIRFIMMMRYLVMRNYPGVPWCADVSGRGLNFENFATRREFKFTTVHLNGRLCIYVRIRVRASEHLESQGANRTGCQVLCKTQRGRIFDPGFCQKMKDFWTFFEVFLTLFG